MDAIESKSRNSMDGFEGDMVPSTKKKRGRPRKQSPHIEATIKAARESDQARGLSYQ